ncbi:capsid protein [Crucivirus-458]|nr:capsid protein [Crucivirus-458]
MYEGQGAYGKGSSNSLIQGSNRTPPRFGSVADETGALIVTHREYIGDIFGPESTARNFKNRVYDLNPGLERTFPWLSQIAQNYEEYEFGQLVFEFKSTVNPSVSGDGQMGTIVQVTNYNSGSRPFDDKNSMMQYDGSQSTRSTQHAVHGVECDPSKISGASGHYIRTGPMPDEDIKSYDHGKYQLATVGMPSNFDNDPIGELWVYYTVKLRKPRLYTGKALGISRDVYVLNQSPEGSMAHLDSANWARHASNSLGTNLSFVTAVNALVGGVSTPIFGRWKMTFPASYAGNLELRMMVSGNMHGQFAYNSAGSGEARLAQLNNIGFASLVSNTSSDVQFDPRSIEKTGNVSLIQDMFGAYPGMHASDSSAILAPKGLSTCGAASGTDDRHDLVMAICHIKVGVATGGDDNSITFTVPRVDDTAGTMLQIAIDCCEYNTFDADPTEVPEGKYKHTVTSVALDPKGLTGF